MSAYEKLGAFYLGRSFDTGSGKLKSDLVLYDSKDLTTHAVIIGMTGSGKTGLAIGLLEEALIDNVPVIAIDPKGDLPNLLLTFPDLAAADFLPWVDPQEAARAGLDAAQFAARQAELWRKGLADWDQTPERIARLRAAAEFAVYTPGSRAGIPVNVLGSFEPPAAAVREDRDLLRERVQGTTTALLSLAGLEADATGREHTLVATLLHAAWSGGTGLDLPGLIRAIQDPPFNRVGVMDLDAFFPAKERFQLAMRFNALLAAPGFDAWLEGDPLDVGRLLFTPQGRPRASIFSISHLGDAERMFFVSKLLNEVLAWVRTQPGTSSLRALLYMDEIFGYFPPVANPPSKQPLLTLLKQARAFGLGVVLSTQNPVDLDYKGLANTGTWFIGRLQTEGDKNRVMAGLEGAAAGGAFDRGRIEKTISGLGKRVFLMNNVHENEPAIFQTRWTLSYLAGPMTRDHIRRLAPAAPAAAAAAAASPAATAVSAAAAAAASAPPVLAPGISAWYLQPEDPDAGVECHPHVLAGIEIRYTNSRLAVDQSRRMALAAPLSEGPVALDWDQSFPVVFDRAALSSAPPARAAFAELPAAAGKPKAYEAWRKDLGRWVRGSCPLVILRSERFKLASRPEESRAEFVARLGQAAREQRDLEVEKLRRRYGEKFSQLKDRRMRAEQALAREQEQVSAKKVETAISFGTAILGAFLGRKAVSSTSAGRIGT
ncbi:MAG: DUF87 domain-containing protein, partial [Desulfobacterales bacterium]|nr:DUF87 domain-containing protein [Desulfobacterales bacterium]